MKACDMSFAIMSIAFACMLAGCGNGQKHSATSRNPPDKIIAAIDELPRRLACTEWKDVEGFVYSNVCHAIRTADKKERKAYIVSYTNAVLQLEAEFGHVCHPDSSDLRKRLVMLENYRVFVQWGFALMDESFPSEPRMWDFLLRPVLLMRREMEGHMRRLVDGSGNSRNVESEYVRKLNDHIDTCRYYVKAVWYREARSKMTPSQMEEVRGKVRRAFGTLPPEMAKDE